MTPPANLDPTDHAVTVYWRPGCVFCVSLRTGLRRRGVSFDEMNIWDDPSAAAFVRSVANGNETVPTVTVGGVTLVNPSTRRVVALAQRQASGEASRDSGASGSPRWWWRRRRTQA